MARRGNDDDARWFEENIGRLDTRHIGDKALAHVDLECAECRAGGGSDTGATLCARGRALMEAWQGVMAGTRIAPRGSARSVKVAIREMGRAYAVSPTTASEWFATGKLPAIVREQMTTDLGALDSDDDDAE